MVKKVFALILFFGCTGSCLNAQILVSSGGPVNYAISPYPGNFTGYYDGFSVIFKANIANTGGATMNIAGQGLVNIVNTAGNPLSAGDIKLNQVVMLVYEASGVRFQMISTPGNMGGGGGITGGGTASRIVRWATASTLGNSVIWDDGTKIGIGNTSPSYTLDVTGNGHFSTGIDAEGQINVSNSGNYQGISISEFGAIGAGINLQATNGGRSYTIYSTNSSDGIPGLLKFDDESGGGTRLVISAAGRIGIGTTGPVTKLHVSTGSGVYNSSLFRLEGDYTSLGNFQQFDFARTSDGNAVAGIRSVFSNAGEWSLDFYGTTGGSPFSTNIMRMQGNGRVGIGTTAPGSRLHVVSSTTDYLTLENLTSSSPYGIHLKSPDSDWYLISNVGGTPGKLAFYDAAAVLTRMVIDAAGNVGIGSTTPTTKLQINGDISLSQFAFTSPGTTYNAFATGGKTYVRIDVTNNTVLNGVIPPASPDGKLLILHFNVPNTKTVIVNHLNIGAAVGDQLYNTGTAAAISFTGAASSNVLVLTYIYSSADSKWVLIAKQ